MARVSGLLHGTGIYNSEIQGAFATLQKVMNSGVDQGLAKIYVMLNNAAAARALQTGRTTSSSQRVENFHDIANKAAVLVEVKWVPGHDGIPGNQMADQLARDSLVRDDKLEDLKTSLKFATIKPQAQF